MSTPTDTHTAFTHLKNVQLHDSPRSKFEFFTALKKCGVQFNEENLDSLFENYSSTVLPKEVELVSITSRDLEKITGIEIFYPMDSYHAIQSLNIGLELCTLEAALNLRLQFLDQPEIVGKCDWSTLYFILLQEKYSRYLKLGNSGGTNDHPLLWHKGLFLNSYHSSRNYGGNYNLVFQKEISL